MTTLLTHERDDASPHTHVLLYIGSVLVLMLYTVLSAPFYALADISAIVREKWLGPLGKQLNEKRDEYYLKALED